MSPDRLAAYASPVCGTQQPKRLADGTFVQRTTGESAQCMTAPSSRAEAPCIVKLESRVNHTHAPRSLYETTVVKFVHWFAIVEGERAHPISCARHQCREAWRLPHRAPFRLQLGWCNELHSEPVRRVFRSLPRKWPRVRPPPMRKFPTAFCDSSVQEQQLHSLEPGSAARWTEASSANLSQTVRNRFCHRRIAFKHMHIEMEYPTGLRTLRRECCANHKRPGRISETAGTIGPMWREDAAIGANGATRSHA